MNFNQKFLVVFILFFLSVPTIPIKAHATSSDTYCMAYLYGTTTDKYINYIEQTNNTLTHVLPDFFDITETGNLKINDKCTKEFIDYLHSKNIKVIPFFK